MNDEDKKLAGPNEPGYSGPSGPIGIPTPDTPDLPWRDDSDVPLDQKNHHLKLGFHQGQAKPEVKKPVAAATVSPPPPPPPKPARAAGSKTVAIVISLLLLAALVFAAYWFVLKPKPAAKSAAKTSAAAQIQTTKIIATTTKKYTSANLGLSFSYPSDWTITDVDGSNVLTAVSPAVTLKDVNNQSVTGQITLKIRNQGQALPEFAKGNAVAVLASTKIAYTSPTQNQRANTYVSFLQYATTTAAGGLDGVYVTGDTGYQLGQAIPAADFVPVDPIISITFGQCTTSACTTATPLTIASSSWSDTALSTPLTNMLESFSIN